MGFKIIRLIFRGRVDCFAACLNYIAAQRMPKLTKRFEAFCLHDRPTKHLDTRISIHR